jgi:hypothetical protein
VIRTLIHVEDLHIFAALYLNPYQNIQSVSVSWQKWVSIRNRMRNCFFSLTIALNSSKAHPGNVTLTAPTINRIISVYNQMKSNNSTGGFTKIATVAMQASISNDDSNFGHNSSIIAETLSVNGFVETTDPVTIELIIFATDEPAKSTTVLATYQLPLFKFIAI